MNRVCVLKEYQDDGTLKLYINRFGKVDNANTITVTIDFDDCYQTDHEAKKLQHYERIVELTNHLN